MAEYVFSHYYFLFIWNIPNSLSIEHYLCKINYLKFVIKFV